MSHLKRLHIEEYEPLWVGLEDANGKLLWPPVLCLGVPERPLFQCTNAQVKGWYAAGAYNLSIPPLPEAIATQNLVHYGHTLFVLHYMLSC